MIREASATLHVELHPRLKQAVSQTGTSWISHARQCELMRLPCSTWYYRPGESAENLALMRRIDEQYLRIPFYGSRKLSVILGANRKRVQRLMRVMGIEAIYPKRRATWPTAG